MDRGSEVVAKDGSLSATEANELRRRVFEQEATINRLSKRLQALHELLRTLRQSQYGASSEKLSPDQLGLFNEAEDAVESEEPVETEVQGHTRRSRGRPALPEELPR